MTRTEMTEKLAQLNAELDALREQLADTDNDALIDEGVSIKEEIDALAGKLNVLDAEHAFVLAWLTTPDEPDPALAEWEADV